MNLVLKKKEASLNGDRWLFWRSILGGALTFTEACAADMETIYEANAALNKQAEHERRAVTAK